MRVEPDGPQPCDLAVVGESPGREEVAQGRGFVGPSGRILWGDEYNLIGTVRPRDTVWVTSVCKVPMPEYEWDRLSQHEREQHINELKAELDKVQPKLVLTFGRRASSALVPDFTTITKEQGVPRWVDSRIIMPLWHPAAFLRGNSRVLGDLAVAIAKVPDLLQNGVRVEPGDVGLPETTDEFLGVDFPESIAFLKRKKTSRKRCLLCGETDGTMLYEGDGLKWVLCLAHALGSHLWALDNEPAVREHAHNAVLHKKVEKMRKAAGKLQAAIQERWNAESQSGEQKGV